MMNNIDTHLGAVYYSPSIVTMTVSLAVCEIFSVIFTILEFLTLNNIVSLKSGLEVTQCH